MTSQTRIVSVFSINLNKIRKLISELSPSTNIVLFSIILPYGKNNINAKVNCGIEIIKQFFKTNKLESTTKI